MRLRGATMFWIMGGRELVLAIVACVCPALFDPVETQITHPRWAGFVAWDLVMPVFLFLVGVSLPFAQAKRPAPDESRWSTYGRIVRRVALLWILGMIAQGSLLKFRWDELELYSNTLQAIAVGYMIASLALLHLQVRGQLVLLAALVVGYWVFLTCVPFGGHAAGTLDAHGKFAALRGPMGIRSVPPRSQLYLDRYQLGFRCHRIAGNNRWASFAKPSAYPAQTFGVDEFGRCLRFSRMVVELLAPF